MVRPPSLALAFLAGGELRPARLWRSKGDPTGYLSDWSLPRDCKPLCHFPPLGELGLVNHRGPLNDPLRAVLLPHDLLCRKCCHAPPRCCMTATLGEQRWVVKLDGRGVFGCCPGAGFRCGHAGGAIVPDPLLSAAPRHRDHYWTRHTTAYTDRKALQAKVVVAVSSGGQRSPARRPRGFAHMALPHTATSWLWHSLCCFFRLPVVWHMCCATDKQALSLNTRVVASSGPY